MKLIKYHWQMDVYKRAVDAAMEIFEFTKRFPREEMYSLTDAFKCSYLNASEERKLHRKQVLGKLVNKGNSPAKWTLEKSKYLFET